MPAGTRPNPLRAATSTSRRFCIFTARTRTNMGTDVMPSRLVDALTGFLVALGEGDEDADGEVESLGTAEGSDDDWPQADMVSNAAEHARASAVLERAEGTPRL